jgi:hypothetical protein
MREMPKVDNNNLVKADINSFKETTKDIRKQI